MSQSGWSGEAEQSTPSKQFQSKKYKDSNNQFMKNGPQVNQASFTPFKSSTLQRSTTPLSTDTPLRSGTLRPPKTNPFIYDPPVSQSTPKAVRPGSAMGTMQREQKLTWGRLPPPQTNRAASAMGWSQTMRPMSRHSEMGHPPNGVSRYQSYCTLPRPEQLEPEMLMEMQPTNMFAPPKIISQPPSAMGPGMASDFIRPPSAMQQMQHMQPVQQPILMSHPMEMSNTRREIVNWGCMTTLGGMQILISIVLFVIGVLRITKGAKCAHGIELAFSVFVMIAALCAIIGGRRRSYHAVAVAFLISCFNIIFAIPSFLIGLFPLVPFAFPEIDSSWILADNEPVIFDFWLSFIVGLEILFCLLTCLSFCRSVSVVMSSVDELRLQFDLSKAFSSSPLPVKA